MGQGKIGWDSSEKDRMGWDRVDGMGQFRAGQNGMGQGKMGWDSSEQDRMGWGKMERDSSEQDRMGQGKMEWDKTQGKMGWAVMGHKVTQWEKMGQDWTGQTTTTPHRTQDGTGLDRIEKQKVHN